jgi:hypothetical protein
VSALMAVMLTQVLTWAFVVARRENKTARFQAV